MKRFLSTKILLSVLFCALPLGLSAQEEGNRSLQVKQIGGARTQLRFSEDVLGTHVKGTASDETDKRIRSFTLSAWVKTSNISGQLFGLCLSNVYGKDGAVSVRLDGGELGLRYRILDRGNLNFLNNATMTDKSMPKGEWVHLAVSVNDATKKIVLMRNGVIVGSGPLTDEDAKVGGIGLEEGNSVFFFASAIQGKGNEGFVNALYDEIKLYNRAMTPEEVTADKDLSYTEATLPEGLSAYFPCNADNGSKAIANVGSFVDPLELTYVSGMIFGDNTVNYSPKVEPLTFAEGSPVGSQAVKQPVITIEKPAHGNIYVRTPQGRILQSGDKLEKGTVLSLTNFPAGGYRFVNYIVNGKTYTENTITVTDEDLTVSALFEQQSFSFDLVVGAHGSASATYRIGEGAEQAVTPGMTLPGDAIVTVKVQVDENYTLREINFNGENLKNKYWDNEKKSFTLVLKKDLKVELKFVELFRFDLKVGEHGTASASYILDVEDEPAELTSGMTVASGALVTVGVQADAGYALDAIMIDGVNCKGDYWNSEKKSFSVVVKKHLAIELVFAKTDALPVISGAAAGMPYFVAGTLRLNRTGAERIRLYTMAGDLVAEADRAEVLSLPELPRGVYLLFYVHAGKYFSVKLHR